MVTERWSHGDLDGVVGDLVLDSLDSVDLLVLDDVSRRDDHRLGWLHRAPTVVVGVVPDGAEPSTMVDVAVPADDPDRLDAVLAGVGASPMAARLLVGVLRVVPSLSVADGLVVESLAYSTLLASGEFRTWLDAAPSRTARAGDGDPVRVERDGDVLRVTLATPENRNAFGASMRDALVAALAPAEVDASITTIEVGADGPNFSSGGDLSEFGTAADVARAHQVRTLRSVGAVIDRLRDRVHVRVHGACVGAGVELPAFAGYVSAAADATFRLPEISMGLIPGAGGTVSITHRIGRQRCAELALSGRSIDASEALVIGLVDDVS